ncbi:MAG: UDP-galactopyranose mutase [Bacteroidales bacterium]|nr:UDP-galactopyranose mutase [Bacteroidales bacterium]MBN2756566.1 UDP-galactopyranose mutase [Bacteroidales bacterium]
MNLNDLKYLIVGAGFFGSVIAERIANELNRKVLIIDKRNHIGGNCYSENDSDTGIHYHKYGTHIFHTSNQKVWDYINQFTEFNSYRHQVLSTYKNKVYQMPINLKTINSFYNLNLKPFEVNDFLKSEISKEKISEPKNFEESAILLIGRPLYEAFIKGYTKKQWQKEPKNLPKSILKRLPFRKNYNDSYYFSKWQGIPLNGYTEIFNKLLNNKNIEQKLELDFFDIKDKITKETIVIYSGQLDKYFDYKFGKLEWRTLDFVKKTMQVDDNQGTAVMNFAEEEIPYTRIHEPKHLHPEKNYTKEKTIVFEEYSKPDDGNEPYYPVNDEKNKQLAAKYKEEAKKEKNLIIGGRLGHYSYYDMHQTIESALNVFEQIKKL